MNKSILAIVSIFLLALLIPSVNAVKPATQIAEISGIAGLEFEYHDFDYVKANESMAMHYHVFNTSNGYPITSGISCSFHLYNSSGNHIYTRYMSNATLVFDDVFDIEIKLDSGNFSKTGMYATIFQCNTSAYGGFVRTDFQVTNSGEPPIPATTGEALAYACLLLLSILLLVICLYGGFKLDGNNIFTMGGDLIEVNFNKYIKLGLYLLGYLFLITTSFIAWQMSDYVAIDLGAVIFKTLFQVLYVLFIPLIIGIVIIGFVKWLADVEIHNLAERHLKQR